MTAKISNYKAFIGFWLQYITFISSEISTQNIYFVYQNAARLFIQQENY